MPAEDLYATLGVERTATTNDLRKAHQRLARQHHPDKGGNEEVFKKVQHAYEILTNDDKRRHYDATGSTDEQGMGPGGPGGPMAFPFDIGSLFGMFGRGKPPRGGKAPPRIETLSLTLAQLYAGHSFTMYLDRSKGCGACSGSGAARKESCGTCGGQGKTISVVQMGGMMAHMHGPCGACGGEGSRVLEVCGTCRGSKRLNEKRTLDVKVPAGSTAGEVLVFSEACSEVPEYDTAGDLHLRIEIQAAGVGDRRWVAVQSSHLETDVVLSLSESLIGCRLSLEDHPSQDPLLVQIPPGCFSGDVLCLTGHGMPVRGTTKNGDLYLKIRVVVKGSERAALAAEAAQGLLTPLFGGGCRADEVPEGIEVLKEVYLSKLP